MSLIQSTAYKHLKAVFKGSLVLPTCSNYQKSLKRWSVLAERPAGVIAFVKDEGDVAAAIKFAIENKLEIAIKGGGHSPSGASSTNGGVVVDLSKYLNKITVDPIAKIAHVQGGALWSEVDDATCPHGLATVAGKRASTGVGGLTLGGGYGYLTGRHGLTIDNLAGATVVIADGRVLQANKDENQDLFFAIRGGGSNFGIITSFQFNLHPIPPACWSGVLFFPADKLDQVVKAAAEWKATVMSVDDTMTLGTTHNQEDGSPVVLVECAHLGPEETAKKQFKLFYDIGPTKEISSPKSYLEVNKAEVIPAGKAYFMAGATLLHPTIQVFKAIMSIQADLKAQLPLTECYVGLEIYPTEKIMQVSNDAMAFACRGPQHNFIIDIAWAAEDRDKVDVEEVREKVREIIKATQAGEEGKETTYGNYDDQITGNEKVKKLFGGNYRKLQAIKAEYDPDWSLASGSPSNPWRDPDGYLDLG